MDSTIILSRVLGPFLFIVSLAMMIRRDYCIAVIWEFARASLFRIVLAMVQLLAGLFVLVFHHDWSSLAAGIITFVAYMAIFESLFYLFFPDSAVEKVIDWFNRPAWYVVGGLLGLMVGSYLSLFGYSVI